MLARLLFGLMRPAGGTAVLLCEGPAPHATLSLTARSAGAPVAVEWRIPPSTPLDVYLSTRGITVLHLYLGAALGSHVEFDVAVAGSNVCSKVVAVVPDALPPEGLTFALASCFYDYFAGGAESFSSALRARWLGGATFAILAGDNVYVDIAPDQAELSDANEELVRRYVRYFVDSQYGDAFGSLSVVTTWDDHEFWNNYPEFQLHLSRTWTKKRRHAYGVASKAAIALFQRPLNPAPIEPTGGSYRFAIAPLSFFVADTRSSRTPHGLSDRRMMHPAEFAALLEWLGTLTGPGVLVLGQPLWMPSSGFRDFTPPNYETEYGRLWQAIAQAPYDVMVLSGDVHHSRLLRIHIGGHIVHELVSSPAANIPTELSTALGTYSDMAIDDLDFPDAVETDPAWGPGPTLLGGGLVFGHNRPHAVAYVRVHAVSADRVDVGISLVDHQQRAVARSGNGGECSGVPVFSLRKR